MAAGAAPKKKTAKQTRLDEARARMYHDLVFESAECVFGEKGYEHATMQDIAGEAGVSLKTLYAAFPSKQELYEEIQHVRGREFIDCVAAAAVGDLAPEQRLEQLVRAYVAFLFEHRDWLKIHLQNRQSWGLRPSTEYAAGYWEDGLAKTTDLLREGAEAGVFYADDPQSAAALTQAVMQVLVAQSVADSDTPDTDATADTIMVQLRRLLCISR
jgi:AcrR family transcriptional regulator